ncbi:MULTISPECIES: (Na+)-NQR maturation NqrM [unclassified Ruegeria]|uniref:(Na+)-NQR maturation NqrM n=1 Tax=unclassified Ruegeria TaxID=2625375 RepID=UPI0014928D9C|nr:MULTISPECIES: (Na+)-NQR maturation NqrM [unclassified Ruegeria]NOD88264.1 (Na+)-NQR maturation NqrM [Ruegeria sp. HKCCD4318]NOE13173.1 (Na+)-NQR maturation NqrM [Ruegeria sp. HKCCD4318-2]NOG11285.1 (Na+)-NQR maturation NqrM [Ruegeria sp. HKCCD4315]
MSTFILAFILLALVMVGMSLGVMLMGKTVKGSCGGLNAISGADKCVVCQKDVDPNSPLRDQLQCKRAKKMLEQMERQA